MIKTKKEILNDSYIKSMEIKIFKELNEDQNTVEKALVAVTEHDNNTYFVEPYFIGEVEHLPNLGFGARYLTIDVKGDITLKMGKQTEDLMMSNIMNSTKSHLEDVINMMQEKHEADKSVNRAMFIAYLITLAIVFFFVV